jgi:hypothetical protein
MNHFHIRWSSGALDWARFSTRSEAQEAAKQLMRVGEGYTVEEFGKACQRCQEVMKAGQPRINDNIGGNESSAD